MLTEKLVGNPAYGPGVQQADKLRVAGHLRRSSTNEAAAVRTPINLPSWGHLVQLCDLYRFRGESRLSAVAKADHAYAYNQPPLATADELSAAAS